MIVRPIITHAVTVFWPTEKFKRRDELSKLQRLACLSITEAMKMALTAITMMLLGLHPLHLHLEGEAQAGL
jgi:hypothetical protein